MVVVVVLVVLEVVIIFIIIYGLVYLDNLEMVFNFDINLLFNSD